VSVSPPTGEAGEQPNREAFGTAECPRCGTPHEPDQEYCLECGLRLPSEARGVVPRLGSAWRSRVGWYPGDWVWPSLLALVIAALAGIGAAAFVSHDEKRTGYVTGTSPVGAPPATTAPFGETTLTTTTPATSVPTQTGTQPPAPNGRPFALAQARAAVHSGLKDVGIIDSSQFASLHPGYYLLFTGIYTSFDDANTATTTARSHGYPRAYPRQITP